MVKRRRIVDRVQTFAGSFVPVAVAWGRRRWPWVLGALGVLVLLVLLWGLGPSWWRRTPPEIREGQQTQDELHAVQQERAALQATVRELARRIQEQSELAAAARARADREAAGRRQLEGEAQRLRDQVAQIEAQRRAQPRARGLGEVHAALRALGY